MGAWNIVQKLGWNHAEQVERHAQLAEQGHGVGQIESKILYEENDGVWLKLQGASRQKHGVSKEMKVDIAYDGVQWAQTASGKRKCLDNKVAYATFDSAKEFFRSREGLVASRFRVDGIDLRVLNGDGTQWIQNHTGEKSISVLDEYHRNRKIGRCVKDKEKAHELYGLLYAGKISDMPVRIEQLANASQDPAEAEGLKELLHYYIENKDALPGYYDCGMEIPETRLPGEIHHATPGSMESNIFTLIGNRMKDRRACWSVDGANNLALLLCQKHTSGFEDLFPELPPVPVPEETEKQEDEWKMTPILSASKVPERTGHGYEFYMNVDTTNTANWIHSFVNHLS